MKIIKFLMLILILISMNFEVFGQLEWGPSQTSVRRDIYKIGTNNATSHGLADPNSVIFIGKESMNQWDRAVYQWDISSIPDGSEIQYVHLYFQYSKSGTAYELDADLFNITYDIISEIYFEEIYDQMDNSQYRIVQQYSGVNNVFDYESDDPYGGFNQAIANSLSNDKFVLGLKWFNDHTTYISYSIWNVSTPSMTLEIVYNPPNRTVTVDQILSNNSVDSVGLWNPSEDEFENFQVPQSFNWDISSYQTLRGFQKLLSNQKYIHWEHNSQVVNDVTNHKTFQIYSYTNNLTSRFNPTNSGITIENSLEGTNITGGNIKFIDPWYIDLADQDFDGQHRNRGMDDAYPRERQSLPFVPDYSTIFTNGSDPSQAYQGVFLNQSGPPLWNPPYYSVQALTDHDIIMGGKYGTRTFYFYKWGGSNVDIRYYTYQSTGVVFKTSDAKVDAVLKGHLLSGAELGTNGQRHLVRDSEGYYHMFYVSIDKLWYTRSLTTNITGAWDDELNLFEQDAKSVSVDIDGDLINIVYEGKSGSNYKIYRSSLNVDTWNLESPVELTNISSSYFGNAHPVVVATTNERFFVYRKSSTGGLYYIRQYYDGIWHTENETSVPNTGFTSLNPAVCMDRQGTYYDVCHLVYQDGNIGTSIKYTYWSAGLFRSTSTISGSSGYSINTNPSVSPVKKDKGNGLFRYDPIVSWLGTSGGTLGKTDGESISTPRLIVRACNDWTQNTWGSTNVYGEEVNSTQNGSVSDVFNQSVIAWGQKDGTDAQWVRRVGTTYYGPYCLEPEGYSTNISNGTSLSNIRALTFDNADLPYIINPSGTGFTGTPDCGGEEKVVTTYPFTFSRAGVILKKGIEFAYHTGDVVLDDSAVQFIEVPDTLTFGNSDELNQILKTKDFPLNSNSSLVFSNYYYVLNKEFADSLTTEESVSYRVELVNSASGNVAGAFDNIVYNKQNLDDYENISYQIDCSGIAEGNYFFRLVTSVTGEAEYNLVNAVNDASSVAKRSFDKISFTGDKIPVTYDLSQNFPNPFNPATTINYQLPQTGHVTLKIYDILGREVATLVNEQKVQGRYSVNFNASHLASGVYIYQVRVNNYVSSKKMLLLK